MFTKLAFLVLGLLAAYGEQLQWDSPWKSSQSRSPEPRSFASLAGIGGSGDIYFYGGFSHARNTWLDEVWSLPWNASQPKWEQLSVDRGDLDGPVQHATLLWLGGKLLVAGGKYTNQTFNNQLFALDPADARPAWRSLNSRSTPAGPDSMPPLYWHSAVSYTVQGSTRVLLCGGLDANDMAVNRTFELSYDMSAGSAGSYSIIDMPSMPVPLFGHSMAAALPAGAAADSLVYVSGGLTGSVAGLAAGGVIPPGLREVLEASTGGPTSTLAASAAVFLFNRTDAGAAGGAAGGSGGTWKAMGGAAGADVMPRSAAFHASWVRGSVLYLYGGTQSAAVQASSSIVPPYGLQAYQLATSGSDWTASYSLSAVHDAVAAWGAVRPGAVAGAAVWAGVDSTGTQPLLWLFGGWSAPQPLPLLADSYLAPQDSSLAWCLTAGDGGSSSSSSAGRWRPPVQGGMAPRSAVPGGGGGGGMLVVAVTVGGARKLLSVGGRAAGGWRVSGSGFVFDASDLHLPAAADGSRQEPQALATSYQLYDMWLIDPDTGARDMIWYYNSTAVHAAAWCNTSATTNSNTSCSSLPYGTSVSPAALGPMWDRRLLEAPPGSAGVGLGTGTPGSSNQAIYMHTTEVLGADNTSTLRTGVWRLTVSVVPLPLPAIGGVGNEGVVSTYVATWQEMTPGSDSSGCYPRILYGAAHLTSTSGGSTTTTGSQKSYIAVHGGVRLIVSAKGSDGRRTMFPNVTDSVCLLDVANARWLGPPQYPAKMAPEARYRHACAPRPGTADYSMTCYGGVSAASGAALADAWTFMLQPGIEPGPSTPIHAGSWVLAPANYSAVRPGPRVDHSMLSVRGSAAAQSFPPVILLGGSLNPGPSFADDGTDGSGSTAAITVRRDVWMLDAAGCPDPDASDAAAIGGAGAVITEARPPLAAQVWLSLIPYGSWKSAAQAAGAEESWSLAAATLMQTNTSLEVWLVLLSSGAQGGAGDMAAVRLVAPLPGCLSLQPSCGTVSYTYGDASSLCWPGAVPAKDIPGIHVRSQSGKLTANGVLLNVVGFVVLDSDGVAVHVKDWYFGKDEYLIEGIVLPADISFDSLTVVSYSKPYVEIGRSVVSANGTALLSFSRTNLVIQVHSPDNTACSPDNTACPNATVELRVFYNGLYRKRHCDTTNCDVTSTNKTGHASFEVFPVSANQTTPAVSYVVLINTSYAYGTYAALVAPSSSSKSSSITLPGMPPPPPDGRVAINLSISFYPAATGYSLNLPSSSIRSWTVGFSPVSETSIGDSELELTDTYIKASAPHAVRLMPGCKMVQVVDSSLPAAPFLFEGFQLVDAPAAMTLRVPLAAVKLRLYFARVMWPISGPGPITAAGVFVKVSTVSGASVALLDALVKSGGEPLPADSWGSSAVYGSVTPWDELDSSSDGSAVFSLLPGTVHRVDLSYASGSAEAQLGSYYFKSPAVPTGTFTSSSCSAGSAPTATSGSSSLTPGSSSSSPSPSLAADGGVSYNITLNYTLLCRGPDPTYLHSNQGTLPTKDTGKIVYGPGISCTWVIFTNLPIISMEVNSTGLSSGESINITLDDGYVTLNDTSRPLQLVQATNQVTISFQASRAPSGPWMGTPLQLSWQALSAGASMPPQFIMMIAASSAAAGAMLLFLCLWHCVVRPVQMRRQAAALALVGAAGAAAAAAGGEGGGMGPPGSGPRAVGAHRNRVPRRYLRMMETSVYSIKEAAGRAASASERSKPPTSSGAAPTANTTSPPTTTTTTTTASTTPPSVCVPTPTPEVAPEGAAAPAPTPAASADPAASGLLASSGSHPASHSDPEAAGGELCAICLCEFEDGDRLKHLPCKHFYHVPCIEQWLGRDVTCPLCKANVLEAMRTLFGPLPPRNNNSSSSSNITNNQRQNRGGVAGGVQVTPASAGDSEDGVAVYVSSSGIGGVGGGGGTPDAVGGAAAAAAGAVNAASASGQGGAPSAGSAGGGGGDLQMVVIVRQLSAGGGGSVEGPAVNGADGGGNQSAGAAVIGALPGSTDSWHGGGGGGGVAAFHYAASGSPSAAAAEAAITPLSGAATIPTSAGVIAHAGAGGVISDMESSVPAAAPGARAELRPMRRHISNDLAAYRDGGTSSESDSDSESEQHHMGTAHHAAVPGTQATSAAAVGVGTATPGRAFHTAVHPVFSVAAATAVAVGSPYPAPSSSMNSAGNAFAAPAMAGAAAASLSASAAAASASPVPDLVNHGNSSSPRVLELIHRSTDSSSCGGVVPGRMGGSSAHGPAAHAPPSPRTSLSPGSGAAAPPAVAALPSPAAAHQRRLRAQEAQMAVAAAALSAAAAGISSGGSGGAGGSYPYRRGMGPAGAAAAPAPECHSHMSAVDGAVGVGGGAVAWTAVGLPVRPSPPAPDSPAAAASAFLAAAAATAAVPLNYRIHENPLAHASTADGNGSTTVTQAASAAAASSLMGARTTGASSGGMVSVLFGSPVNVPPATRHPSGSTASVFGNLALSHGTAAVPEVSAGSEDVVRALPPSALSPSAAARHAVSSPTSCGGGGLGSHAQLG
ncbi:hypothetical protein Agub_g7745 [Astrephomene gubernaculifera]|uniref:RING-type domain-containing protein n=1 Tax=Astrephomene gubernaculifera TaxID=47775 RepID=A0AAD3HMI0_9CHLO|nr:hypothetical protein Agub_g7745 [Astrephomene gubernaculifera]